MQKVNKFPLEVFPMEFQAIILHNKEIQNFDINLSALSYLSAAATTIGSNIQINNGSYISRPIFWSVLVANSGMKKSHIMEFPYQFLRDKDRNEMNRFKSESENKETNDICINQPKTFILKDSTPEALSSCLSVNSKGAVLFKDELARMMKDFNKYSKGGGEQDSLLELFNGNDLSVHRAHKPTLYISKPCVNLIGGIQPDRLSLIANEESFTGGFYYRVLFARPLEYKPNVFNMESINKDIEQNSINLFQEIFNYPEIELTVSKESLRLYQVWYDKNQIECFNDLFDMPLQSKLETYVWRFCIVLDVLDQVSTNSFRSIITKETMEKALTLAEYFRAESTNIYEETRNIGTINGETTEFQKLYNKLEEREYSTKELQNHFKNCIGPDMVNKKLTVKNLFLKMRKGIYKKTILNVTN
jgi:hypothetical protein